MSRTLKWVTGILIGLVVVCMLAAAGYLVFSRIAGTTWGYQLQLSPDRESRRLIPRGDHPWERLPGEGVPWDEMPMRPFHAYPGRILPAFLPSGGFFGGLLLCLGSLGLVLLVIAALVLAITRSRRPSSAALQEAAPVSPVEPVEAAAPARLYPSCERPVEDDWSHCPYCGSTLTPPE